MSSPEQTLKDDPNIKLPAAVRAAAARSDAIVNEIRTQQGLTSPSNEPVVEPTDDGQQPIVSEEEIKPPKREPKAKEPNPDESWEHKYRSVKGRLDQSNDQLAHMAEQIQNLQGVIASMQASSPSSEVPKFNVEKLVTDQEVSDYGEDFLKVVGKRAKEELGPIIKAYESQIEDLKRQISGVNSVVQQDAKQKLLSDLDKGLPNWRDLNRDEDFLGWLALPDPFSGAIRHDMLKAAYTQGDARRVLAFFNGFLSEEAATKPAKAEPDGTTERVAKVPLASLAAPGRAKTAASNTGPAEKPVFTRSQIAAFYADVAANRYRGRDAEKVKIEGQIFEAQHEGRIR